MLSVLDELAAAVDAVLATVGDRADAARAAAAVIRAQSPARWVGIYTVADGLVVNEAWDGPGPPAHPRFPVDQGLTAHAVRTASVAVSNDVAIDPRYLANQGDTGSELIVPVLVDGVVRGTLDLERDVIGGFDGALIATFEQVASRLQPLWSGH